MSGNTYKPMRSALQMNTSVKNHPADDITDFALLQPGHQYKLNDLVNPDRSVSCQCTQIHQRNWSRVGSGQIVTEDGNTHQVFLKQNVSRNGEILLDQWDYEKSGATIASELFQKTIFIPRLIYHNESLALCVFEYIDIIPFDELLRQNNSLFQPCFTAFLDRSVQLLQTMQSGRPGAMFDALSEKQRPYGSSSTSINFKGFDIRNIGIINEQGNQSDSREFAMFDFGRPYQAPIEEAAAKLFISIGLLNWGKPIHRFAKGPDTELLSMSLPYLQPYLAQAALNAELDLQTRFRSSEVKGSGIVEKSIKKFGIDSLGKRYLNQLRAWCDNHIDEV